MVPQISHQNAVIVETQALVIAGVQLVWRYSVDEPRDSSDQLGGSRRSTQQIALRLEHVLIAEPCYHGEQVFHGHELRRVRRVPDAVHPVLFHQPYHRCMMVHPRVVHHDGPVVERLLVLQVIWQQARTSLDADFQRKVFQNVPPEVVDLDVAHGLMHPLVRHYPVLGHGQQQAQVLDLVQLALRVVMLADDLPSLLSRIQCLESFLIEPDYLSAFLCV